MFYNSTIDGFKKRRADKAEIELKYKQEQAKKAEIEANKTPEQKDKEMQDLIGMINFISSTNARRLTEQEDKIEERRRQNGGW